MADRSQARIAALVLCGGAATLATEVTGARMLAPFFGSSNIVWANVIGLTLIYLSLGYWLGGRLADRHPHERALGTVALIAAAGIAALPFATQPIFGIALDAFEDVSAGAFVASFIGTLAMFALPITALGALAPWAIRLAIRDLEHAGAVAGRLYALSTLGSIAGTFLPVLVLIPLIGSRRTMLCFAIPLALVAAACLGRRYLLVAVAIGALLLVPAGTIKAGDGVLFEGESAYQFVQVRERPSGERVLYLNEGWGLHSRWRADTVLTGGYWDAFLALPLLTGEVAGRLAVLGSAGGTTARAYGRAWPQTRVDGVEIDPLVSEVGARYLGLDENPNSEVHTDDARVYLHRTDRRYDAIIVDAYRQPYIPFHLATREFFELARDRLTAGGVVALNVGTPPDENEIVERIAASLRSVMPAVQVARYNRFNWVVIGYRAAATARSARARLTGARGLPAVAASRLREQLRDVPPDPGGVMTDDLAPVEWLTDTAILSYLEAGGPGS